MIGAVSPDDLLVAVAPLRPLGVDCRAEVGIRRRSLLQLIGDQHVPIWLIKATGPLTRRSAMRTTVLKRQRGTAWPFGWLDGHSLAVACGAGGRSRKRS